MGFGSKERIVRSRESWDETFEFRGEKWNLGWIPSEVLNGPNPVEETWDILAPVIEAVMSVGR